jgi:hypothetical protein
MSAESAKVKKRRTMPGSKRGGKERAASVTADKEAGNGEGTTPQQEHRARAIRTMERVVFLPVELVPMAHKSVSGRRWMLISTSRVRICPAFARRLFRLPRVSGSNSIGSLSPSAAPSTSSFHPIASTSTSPVAADTSQTARSSSTSTTMPIVKPKRVAGPSVPPHSTAARPGWGGVVLYRSALDPAAGGSVRAVERVQGSGGCGAVALDCNAQDAVLESAEHVTEAGERYRYAGGYVGDGFGCAGAGK